MADTDSIDEFLNRKARKPKLRTAVYAGASAFGIAFVVGASWFAFAPDTVPAEIRAPDSIFTSSYGGDRSGAYDDFSGLDPRPMPICRSAPFDNCVVDGDTFWLNGRKIRLANADAPELQGRCAEESARARQAAQTLSELLDDEPITIRAQGRDRSGRLLATISTRDGDVGRNMIRFKEAVKLGGRREPDTDWCAG